MSTKRMRQRASGEQPVDLLQDELQNYRKVIDHLKEGLCLFDKRERLVLCNKTYVETFSIPKHLQAAGTEARKLLEHRVECGFYPNMEREVFLSRGKKFAADAKEVHTVHHHRDGRTFSVNHIPMKDGGWLTTYSEITEVFKLRREIEHLAFHDHLTGLANRAQFQKKMSETLLVSGGSRSTSILFIDLDGFKAINDTMSHAAGDEVLKAIAGRLRNCFREEDTVARMGGDEFAVLLVAVPEPQLKRLAERVIGEICKPMKISGKKVCVGCSIGIVSNVDPDRDPDELLRQADQAMYSAKKAGGRRYSELRDCTA